MPASLPVFTADEIIALVQLEIDRIGPVAFDCVQLYSGPDRKFARHILDYKFDNKHRPKEQTKENDALTLDDTEIGKFLNNFMGVGIYEYFYSIYGPTDPKSILEADKVMAFASEGFIDSVVGKIYTAVCGANPIRIYPRKEIPRIVENKKIEGFNDTLPEPIRNQFKRSADRTLRYASLLELRHRLHHAIANKDQKVFMDYLDRNEFYVLGRQERTRRAKRKTKPIHRLTPRQRLERKQKSVLRFAILNMQPMLTTIEHEKASGFRPYCAANPGLAYAL